MAVSSDTHRREKANAIGPIGVADIGSNSVRLVVYEAESRAPAIVFNEKAMCAIGRNMVSTGRLDEEGMELAIKAMQRFRAVAEIQKLKRLDAIATAAVRDARNGAEFVARARDALGVTVRVLTGEEEARTAAEGVLAGIPEADGLVGDLGGGSLELVPVAHGQTGVGHTFPFGPLRLMDASGDRLDKARAIVDEGLSTVTGFERLKGKALYAVGGVWRNIARVHMAKTKHPVKILHHYAIPRDEALEFAEYLAGQSKRHVEAIAGVSRKRAEAIPYGALVLERLLKISKLDRVIVSAYGLREGVLFSKLSPDIRKEDPLLSAARDMAAREARDSDLEEPLMQWAAPVFPGETQGDARLRRAASILADDAWRGHPDHRGQSIFNRVLHAPFYGVDHRGRAFMALALYHRYVGDEEESKDQGRIAAFLGPEAAARALVLGQALRLAFSIAGPSREVLNATGLKLTPSALTLNLPKAQGALVAEPVQKRLEALGEALGRVARIDLR
jgi:exopolyphosphatase/guanosine-5'-triphosphate,3'-diphosphate pyrophosphatase